MKKFMRVISVMLVVLMLASVLSVQSFAATSPFSDVKTDRWSYQYIEKLYGDGIVNGKGGDKFAPADNVTRSEFVKILGGVAGIDPTEWATARFTDVKYGSWYYGYVAWAVSYGITTGTSDSTFSPTSKITRQDMATMIYRYAYKEDIELYPVQNKITFADNAAISSYAAEPVAAMQQAGIISGVENADGSYSFNPKKNASREQACKMLCVLYTMTGSIYRNEAFDALKTWVLANDSNSDPDLMYNSYPSYTVEVENTTNPTTGVPYVANYCIFYDEGYDEIGVVVDYYEESNAYYVKCAVTLTKAGESYIEFVDRRTDLAGANIEGGGYNMPYLLSEDNYTIDYNLYFDGDYADDAEAVAICNQMAKNLAIVAMEYTNELIFAKHLPKYEAFDFGFNV